MKAIHALSYDLQILAELFTIYHLTEKLNQPFKMVVKWKGKQVMNYEPARNARVRERYKQLGIFYNN